MSNHEAGVAALPHIELRSAEPADAVNIDRIFRESWMDTYPSEEFGITLEDVDAATAHLITEEHIGKLAVLLSELPDNVFYAVADADSATVGTSRARLAGDEETFRGEPFNKLETIYVLTPFHGKGVGPKLFEASLDFLGPEKQVLLEVAVYNDRAISFYERYGFYIAEHGPPRDGCRLPSGIVLPEYIMVRPAQT